MHLYLKVYHGHVISTWLAKEIIDSTGTYSILEGQIQPYYVQQFVVVQLSHSCSQVFTARDFAEDTHRSSWNKEVQETHSILCVVARSIPADFSTGPKLPGVCQGEQARKRATDDFASTLISMASSWNRSLRIEQSQLSTGRGLLFMISRNSKNDLYYLSQHHISSEVRLCTS